MIECTIGLDTVEFIMQVEDTFGISIPCEDAEKFTTVGELFLYVRERVARGPTGTCLTARAFYRLRGILVEQYGCQRRQVRPSSQLRDLFAKENRKTRLASLGERLRRPLLWATGGRYVERGLYGSLAVLGLACLILLPWPDSTGAAAISLVLAGMFAVVAECSHPYGRLTTVGDLAPAVLETHFEEFVPHDSPDRQTWSTIANLLSEQVGMKRSDVTPGLRFLDIPGDL